MDDSRRKKLPNLDYRILSSYLNRWATVIVFSVIIALAWGALSITTEDMAHMPVVIGVAALDSARAAIALESFAELCRIKGCGDIRWRYLPADGALTGCDFYVTTSLKLSAPLAGKRLGCALIAAEREAHRYSRSAVVVRSGVRSLPENGARVIFSSPGSAAGFLAPCRSLERAGCALERSRVDFAGERPENERVVFGVIYGAYDAGGISLERLIALESSGIVRTGELRVLLEGEALPELVLAYNPATYTEDLRSFARRLPGMLDRAPRSLKVELAALGIAGFYSPRGRDIELMEKLFTMVPPGIAEPGGPGTSSRP
jgi:hypothetical protein